ncbi:hypothetical protein [Mechercharimyces sp. CAU 1602]|uniref:hypothetical protein n=1 Tax=Mechercharimyces sp. CAU 1602 TaxID=2973933 RepID=UPI0021615E34|nr:hypothetical protein [Mechercharimyces sp. CAU 1602]MCS1350241.1 hypothetical protein [Mechercharimyces sp. CAU 1602]
MEVIQEFFSKMISGFAWLGLFVFGIWMVSLFVLLFRELFTPGELYFKEYIVKVWKKLIFSFEVTGYGGVVIAPILMFTTGEVYLNIMIFFAAIVFSAISITVRKKNGSTLFS